MTGDEIAGTIGNLLRSIAAPHPGGEPSGFLLTSNDTQIILFGRGQGDSLASTNIPAADIARAIVIRLKIMAGIDISERRTSQVGYACVEIGNKLAGFIVQTRCLPREGKEQEIMVRRVADDDPTFPWPAGDRPE